MPDLPTLSRDHALFLDFDGTLAPIVARPDLVDVPEAARAALADLHAALGGAVAIVSGREIAELDRLLAPLRPAAAGGHGVEVRFADGRLAPKAGAAGGEAAQLAPLAEALRGFAESHEGLLFERKARGAALHFRARPDLETACREAVARAAEGSDVWRVIAGKMVFEIVPGHENKGRAVEAFLREPPFAGRIPVAAGDDVTDEDMFGAVNALGGISIKVGPGPSAATHRAPDTGAFLVWLGREAAKLRRDPGKGDA